MRLITAAFIILILSACGSSSDEKECDPSAGLFSCINASDFTDATGQSTPQSREIVDCTIIQYVDEVCPLASLNFIANDAGLILDDDKPSKQEILNKLVVSDPWMSNNFSLLLDSMPDDLYRLFSSVTAIIIHRNIRPAFFLPSSGAIYLDPEYIWISESDRNQLSTVADYREAYSNDLNYISAYRYSKAGNPAFNNYEGSRTPEQTLHALSSLLFHELAHARDFFPLSVVTAANIQLNPYLMTTGSGYTSEMLKNTAPLSNQTLFDIAEVKFLGVTASNFIQSLTATQVGNLFDSDSANDEYNYTSLAEDVAMLFEEAMMKQHYGIDRELAFITPLIDTPSYCEDYSWDYSVINRFSETNVLNRVSLVINDLLPINTSAEFLNNFDAGTFTWCQPIAIPMLRRSDINFSNAVLHSILPRY